jgi:hypothetical protein
VAVGPSAEGPGTDHRDDVQARLGRREHAGEGGVGGWSPLVVVAVLIFFSDDTLRCYPGGVVELDPPPLIYRPSFGGSGTR